MNKVIDYLIDEKISPVLQNYYLICKIVAKYEGFIAQISQNYHEGCEGGAGSAAVMQAARFDL